MLQKYFTEFSHLVEHVPGVVPAHHALEGLVHRVLDAGAGDVSVDELSDWLAVGVAGGAVSVVDSGKGFA